MAISIFGHLRELFGDGIAELRTERLGSRQTFRSPDHFTEFCRTWFGPTRVAYERVGPEGGTLVLEPEYQQVVATRA